jgi:hypothetical protein
MGYVIHSLLHFLIGASVTYLLFNNDTFPKKKRFVILMFGGIASIAPDITKFFGDLFGHSVFALPILGGVIARVFYFFIKEFSFIKSWVIFTATILLGHTFIDFVGNGIALFYPIMEKEFGFHIVRSIDFFIVITLLCTIIMGIVFKKTKTIFKAGIVIFALYLSILTISKIQFEQQLHNQYAKDKIELLLVYPSYSEWGWWQFRLRTENVWINGKSSVLNTEVHIESERDVG